MMNYPDWKSELPKGEEWFNQKFVHYLTPVTITALLITLLLVLSVVGIGSADPAPSTLRPGVVRVAGIDVTSGRTINVNLGDDVPVRIRRLPATARDAVYVRLGFSALGLQLPPSRSAPLTPRPAGGLRADVDAQRVRVLVSGKVPRSCASSTRASRSSAPTSSGSRPTDRCSSPPTASPGLLVLAFVITYGWSLGLPLRPLDSRLAGQLPKTGAMLLFAKSPRFGRNMGP